MDPQDNYLTDPLQCNGSINYCLFLSNYYLIVLLIAIGCPLKYIPKDKDLESDPMTIVKTVCVPATLKDHCVPEVSYVNFECYKGYVVDSEYGNVVKILFLLIISSMLLISFGFK